MSGEIETLLTKDDLQKIGNFSLSFVNAAMKSGALRYLKVGRSVRFRRSDWNAFLDKSMMRGA